jgi:hypothetical protein
MVTLSANEAFVFSRLVNANGSYTVTVATQPPGQICTVSNGTGAGVTAQVFNISVKCSAETYLISGSVSGLPAGAQLVLKNNAADALKVTADAAFTFDTPVAFDGSYVVTVGTQPSGVTCTVSQGRGAGVIADVTNVSVVCSPDSFTIGGSVTGLASGAQVTLNDNSGDPLTFNSNGAFTFATPIASQGSYNVTVGTQPVGQTCTVINGTGPNPSVNVTDVSVTCSTNSYTVSGGLSGLSSASQVTLFNNGADPITLTADGTFTFEVPMAYGSAYAVTVGTQPNGQYCSITGGTGSQITADVTSVSVSCVSSSVSFTTPGVYTWTVPQGITSIAVVAMGGGGGGGGKYGVHPGIPGGAGAIVSSTLTVSSGQVLNLVVSGGGMTGTDGPAFVGGGYSCGAGGGGGGAASLDAGDVHQVIAGGGGGGASCMSGSGGGVAGGVVGAGGNGSGRGSNTTGGFGGAGGTGGAGGERCSTGSGTSGGNGSGGAGGAGGSNGSMIAGGAGGGGQGAGSGGDSNSGASGGGGGGYGGGGSGYQGTSGGAGGSVGPTGTTYAPATNGGATSVSGGDGSIVITLH